MMKGSNMVTLWPLQFIFISFKVLKLYC